MVQFFFTPRRPVKPRGRRGLPSTGLLPIIPPHAAGPHPVPMPRQGRKALERRFEFYREDLDPAVTLVVDGVAPAVLNLSHWPGNRTPSRYRADTTTEMALHLAGDPQRERFLEGIRIVSNNHFDTDGLLSAWAVLHPDEALRH